MKPDVFEELDHRLSNVLRWSVIRTIQKQSVAEHCFNVERIARGIAAAWMNDFPDSKADLLSQWALHHDDVEAITGDIPRPVKPALDEKILDRRPRVCYDQDVVRIVKLADYMEATWFLAMELRLGNQYASKILADLAEQTTNYAKAHFKPDVVEQVRRWTTQLYYMESKSYGATPGSPEKSDSIG